MAYGVSDTAIGSIFIDAEIAQLVEQRIRNAWVEGSSPFFGFKPYTPKPKRKQGLRGIFYALKWF